MDFRVTNFLLTTLLSTAVFGMDSSDPYHPTNKIAFTAGEHADVGALFTKLSTMSATSEDAQDFLADPELQALFDQNMQAQGIVLNIFHKTSSLLKHHTRMISLLESPKIDPLEIASMKKNDQKLGAFFEWTDSLFKYTKMNGIPKIGYFSSADLLKLQKGKGISSAEKTYITSLIQRLNDRQCSLQDQSVFSLTPEVISNIFSTAKTDDHVTALLNTLTRMLRMSRDCFLNIERKKVSLYQNFMNDLSNNSDKTVVNN